MKNKRKTTLRDKLAVFIILSPLIAFLISIILNACGQEDKNLYLGIGTVILWVIGLLSLTFIELLKEWKHWRKIAKWGTFLTAFITISFLSMFIMVVTKHTTYLLYTAISTIIIGGGGILLIFLIELIHSYQEYKASVLLADLEEFQLPKFLINEKTKRLYQIYNYNIIDNTLHSSQCYSLISDKIRIFSKKGWTTTLYHINNIIFVNCTNKKHSWWGLCQTFEKNQPIWGLHHEFELYYNESIQRWCKPEIIPDTKIKGAEQSQFDPEID